MNIAECKKKRTFATESLGVNFFSANCRALSTKSGRIHSNCQPKQY